MSLADVIKTTLDQIKYIAKTETVIGEPITAGEVTLIPVSRVSVGFAAGGGGENEKGSNGGSGTGGGINITPIAFISIHGNHIQVHPVTPSDPIMGKILSVAPDLIGKISKYWSKKDEMSSKEKKERNSAYFRRVKMFDINDGRFLWVSPDALVDGNGSFEQPFDSIESAMNKVVPGNTVILMSGLYDEDVTIQVSGSINKPIKIVADENAKVEILGSCWFFYDTSDFIVSGLTFKDAPQGAISVIGACERNRFEYLQFINCGTSSKPSCTMYFGGTGAENNVVEGCVFTRTKESIASISDNAAVGLMVSEGDGKDGTVIKHHVFRRNRFDNYYHGIIIGSNDTNTTLHSHVVEYNTITNTVSDGILVKCGDTLIRGNLIKNSSQSAIKVSAGSYCIIENNRIEKCLTGIAINGEGHTLSNNNILSCANQAVSACKATSDESIPATNLFIESNTFVNCGAKPIEGIGNVSGIVIEPGTTCILNNNLIHGDGIPYIVIECDAEEKDSRPLNPTPTGTSKGRPQGDFRTINAPPKFVITGNAASGPTETLDGFSLITAIFPASHEGNFENSSGFGAQGWVLKPEGYDPDMDNLDSDTNYIDANMARDLDDDIQVEDEDNDEVVDEQSSGDDDDEENVVQEKLFASFFSDFDAEEVPTLPPEEPWAD